MKQFISDYGDPIPFEIDGEEFTIRADVPAKRMADLSQLPSRLRAAQDDPRKNPGKVMTSGFYGILDDESFARFDARCDGEGKTINLRTFNEVVEWVLGETAGKETGTK